MTACAHCGHALGLVPSADHERTGEWECADEYPCGGRMDDRPRR